jgi:hypothetical protein
MGKKVGNMLCRKKTGGKCSWDGLVPGHLAQNWRDQRKETSQLQEVTITADNQSCTAVYKS